MKNQLRISLSRATLAVSALALIISCAPKPEKVVRAKPTAPSGPRLEDVDLRLSESTNTIAWPNGWASEVSAAVVFRMTENFLTLREGPTPEARLSWLRGVLKAYPHARTSIADSDYSHLLVEESEEMAKKKIADVVATIRQAPRQIQLILQRNKSILTRQKSGDFDSAVTTAFSYLEAFDSSLGRSNLMPEIIAPLRREMRKQLAKRQLLTQKVATLKSADTIQEALKAVNDLAESLGSPIIGANATKIENTKRLARQVDAIQDARGALSALIEVWIQLPQAQRQSVIRAANADLYDYLAGLSLDELRCHQDPNCFSITQWIARTAVILPKIEAYGVGRIKTLMNRKGADAVRDQVLPIVWKEVRELPETIALKVEKEIDKRIQPLEKLKVGFAGEMKSRLKKWAQETLEKDHPSIYQPKPARARMQLAHDGSFQVQWTEMQKSSPEAVGAFDSILPVLWRTPGLERSEIEPLIASKVAALAGDFQRSRQRPGGEDSPAAPIPSARVFAEVIRGLSSLAVAFRESEKTVYDQTMGSYKAAELFPEFDAPDLDRSLFPKDAFFALSFRSLAQNLKSLRTDHSHIFLIDAKKRVVLANEEASEETVMAGIADRVDGVLSPTVRAEDVARYLLAMSQTLEATRGVEATTSNYLLKPLPSGEIPRDEIVKSREQIRLLILGLANYLSHQFRAGGDLIRRELDVATQRPFDRNIAVMDQVLAIRALLAASNALGIDLYRWEAVDLLMAMNRQLYRRDLGFYARQDETAISPAVLLETLRAIEELSPYLKPASRAQVEKLAAPWRAKLATWRLDRK